MGSDAKTEEHTGEAAQEFQLHNILHLPENESPFLRIKTLRFIHFPDCYLEYKMLYVSDSQAVRAVLAHLTLCSCAEMSFHSGCPEC